MKFSAPMLTLIQIGLVCLTGWVCPAWGQESVGVGAGAGADNALQATGQMQPPVVQPQLQFDTFTGPGSSVASESQQPFNTVPAAATAGAGTGAQLGAGGATTTGAGAGAATGAGTGATTVTAPAEAIAEGSSAAGSIVQPQPPRPPRPEGPDGQLPPFPTNGGGKRPDGEIPPGMGPLIALLKAILSGQGGLKVIGGGPCSGGFPGGPAGSEGPGGAFGGGFGGPGGFGGFGGGMGGPRPSRRVRIMILRKPRGGQRIGGFGGGQGPMAGGFGGPQGEGSVGGGFGGPQGERPMGGGFGGAQGERPMGGGFGSARSEGPIERFGNSLEDDIDGGPGGSFGGFGFK